FPLLERLWALDDRPDFEGGHLLIPRLDEAALAHATDRTPAAVGQVLAALRVRLRAARSARGLPVDTKRLAGWNGLMLTALSEAARRFDAGHPQGRYTRAARAQRDFIVAHFLVAGRLLRVHPDGHVPAAAELEDYTLVAAGLRDYGEVFGADADAERRLRDLTEQAWARFYAEEGGWRLGEDALLHWGVAGSAVPDGPLPAPPAVLMAVSQDLGVAVPRLRQALAQALPVVRRAPFVHASYAALYRRD
ncbi:MAG: hypothetical protein WCY26_07235, partial [Thiohalobacteraceae bacterium]